MKTMFSSNPIVLEKYFFLKETIFIPLTWIGIRFLIEGTNRDSSRVHKKNNLALALAIKLSQNHKYAQNTKTFHEPS